MVSASHTLYASFCPLSQAVDKRFSTWARSSPGAGGFASSPPNHPSRRPLSSSCPFRLQSLNEFLGVSRNRRGADQLYGRDRGCVDAIRSRTVSVRSSLLRTMFELSDGGLTGPVQLPPEVVVELGPLDMPEASPLQTFASILLTGAITLLLLRSLRRRFQRAKETKFRSNAVERLSPPKSSLDVVNPVSDANSDSVSPPTVAPPPNPLSTFGGALISGLIGLILYNFTSSVEEGFSNQAVSANYSVRNITITVRTIITGICWLSTFVFGFTSVGLSMYAFQLALGLIPSEGVPLPPSDSSEGKEQNEKK